MLPRVAVPAQNQEVGVVDPVVQRQPAGPHDVAEGEAFAVGFQRPVAERLGAEFDVGQARSPEQPHLLGVDAPRREVGAPCDVRPAPDERFGQPDVVFGADVEHRVGEEQVIYAVIALGAEDVFGDDFGVHRAHAPPVDMRIRTVNALVGASPLGLDVEHAAPLPVIPGQLRLELHFDRRQITAPPVSRACVSGGAVGAFVSRAFVSRAFVSRGCVFRAFVFRETVFRRAVSHRSVSRASVAGVDCRNVCPGFAPLQGSDQLRQRSFALAVNAVIGSQLTHERLRIDRESRSADNQGCVAGRAYDVDQRLVLRQKPPPVERIGAVHVAQRHPDIAGRERADAFGQLFVREQVAVGRIDTYPVYRAFEVGFQVGNSERINGVGRRVAVCRNE